MKMEIRNTKTGATKWIDVSEAGKYGVSPPQESTLNKLENIPLLGNSIVKPVTKVLRGAISGYELKRNLPTISENTMNQQMISRDYAKRAQTEIDPTRKQQLLQQSRGLSRGASQTLSDFTDPLTQILPQDYQNRETPQGNTLTEIIGTLGKLGVIDPRLGQMYGTDTYADDAISSGGAVATAASIPSMVRGAIKTGKNYAGNITSEPSVMGKIKQINPISNIQKTYSKIATQAAKNAKGTFKMKTFFDDLISKAENSSIKDQDYYRKSIGKMIGNTAGLNGKEIAKLSKMSMSELKAFTEIVPDKTWAKALSDRRTIGSTTNWLKKLLNTKGTELDKMAYNSFNNQLKTIPGVSNADKAIANLSFLNKILKYGAIYSAGKKAIPGVLKQILPVGGE